MTKNGLPSSQSLWDQHHVEAIFPRSIHAQCGRHKIEPSDHSETTKYWRLDINNIDTLPNQSSWHLHHLTAARLPRFHGCTLPPAWVHCVCAVNIKSTIFNEILENRSNWWAHVDTFKANSIDICISEKKPPHFLHISSLSSRNKVLCVGVHPERKTSDFHWIWPWKWVLNSFCLLLRMVTSMK